MSDNNIFENTILDSDTTTDTLNEILKIHERCGLSKWTIKDYKNEFNRIDSRQVIVTIHKTIVGFAVMRLIIPYQTNGTSNLFFEEAEIFNIAVDPKLQNRGVGKTLLEKLVAVSLSSGVKTIWLEVRESNYKATNFYKKNNFYYIYTRQNYYQSPSENAWIMKRNQE